MVMLKRYSRAFKVQLVREYLQSDKSRAQLCREYQVSPPLLSRWKAAYLQEGEAACGLTAEDGVDEQLSLQARVRELEELCGRLALENSVLKKRWASQCEGAPGRDRTGTPTYKRALGAPAL
jgi:transposase